MKTKPKKKVYSLKKVKAKAWTAFSLYIRTRDCLKATGTPNLGICVTCGKQCDIKQLQAGHFIGGRTNSVLFVEDNCFAQCLSCNVFLRGNYDKYLIFMLDTVGEKRVRELAGLKKQLIKSSVNDYLELFEKYTKKLEELLS